jgi:hypothetical protein
MIKVGWRPSRRCETGVFTPRLPSHAFPSYSASLNDRPTCSDPTLPPEPDSSETARRNNKADQNTESQVPKSRPDRKDSPTTNQYFKDWNLLPNHPLLPLTHHHLISIDCPLLWPASFSGTSMGRSYHSFAETETQKTIMPMSRPNPTKSSIHQLNISILPASQSTRIRSSGIDRPPGPATVS